MNIIDVEKDIKIENKIETAIEQAVNYWIPEVNIDEIIFDFTKIINWIKTKKGNSRYYPIAVSVAKDNEECIMCSMSSFEFDPWGDYWRVGK